ncbi:hypothetical protein BGZ83_010865 [Gryganskiella cystojenkinii]|nr:hypothetical protein BGZ83_010865 [Gryganskiella cystojenkinii]
MPNVTLEAQQSLSLTDTPVSTLTTIVSIGDSSSFLARDQGMLTPAASPVIPPNMTMDDQCLETGIPASKTQSRNLSPSSTMQEIKLAPQLKEPSDSSAPQDLNEKTDVPSSSVHTTPLPPPLPHFEISIAAVPATLSSNETSAWREGGLKGWLAVLGSLLMHSFVFVPTEFIFGIFALEYSLKFPSSNPSTIALIGTIGTSTTYLIGFVAGACSDRWGYRATAFMGTIIMATSLILASFSTQLWHYYFSQGIMFGTGASLSYFSAIAAPTHWFKRKRGFAMGIAASGAGLGGFILAPLTQHMVDGFGVQWTLRILGIYGFIVCGVASLLLFQKAPSEQEEQIRTTIALNNRRRVRGSSDESSWRTMFKLPPFTKEWGFFMLVAFQFLFSIAYLTPIYSISLYSTFIGLSKQKGAMVNGWFNGASFIARILSGLLADLLGTDVVLLICIWTNALSVLILWTLAKSYPVFMLFAVIYGISFSGTITLTPAMVAEHYGPAKVSRVLGIAFSSSCAALLCGSLISGQILEMTKPRLSYVPVIMYTGGMFAFSGLCATTWVVLMRRQRKVSAVVAVAASSVGPSTSTTGQAAPQAA